jgi:hypothetical protein
MKPFTRTLPIMIGTSAVIFMLMLAYLGDNIEATASVMFSISNFLLLFAYECTSLLS